MLNLFHQIHGAQVVLQKNGVFYQTPVFRRAQSIYAGYGRGYIRLGGRGFTSAPSMSWSDLDLPAGVHVHNGQLGEPIFDGEEA